MTSSSNPVVDHANAAALVIAHLAPLLDPVPVCHDVPTQRPAAFVRVIRTGGPRLGVIDQAQLTIESCADFSDIAETNAQTVRRHINDLPGAILGGYPVSNVVELSGPAELPDPTSNQRRTTWSVQVSIRGI